MRKLWFALLFLAGGLAHEIRHPVQCHCISAGAAGTGKRRRFTVAAGTTDSCRR